MSDEQEQKFVKKPPLFQERAPGFEISYYPLEFKDRKTLQFEVQKCFEGRGGKEYKSFKYSTWELIPLLGALVKAYTTTKDYDKNPEKYGTYERTTVAHPSH